MPTKQPNNTEPDVIGKPHAAAGERARDEQRQEGGPRYGGEPWEVADERGDRRFGHARNDDADPSELTKGEADVDDDSWPGDDASPKTQEANAPVGVADTGETESGGQRAGFGRGEHPRKPAAREKPNPRGSKH